MGTSLKEGFSQSEFQLRSVVVNVLKRRVVSAKKLATRNGTDSKFHRKPRLAAGADGKVKRSVFFLLLKDLAVLLTC